MGKNPTRLWSRHESVRINEYSDFGAFTMGVNITLQEAMDTFIGQQQGQSISSDKVQADMCLETLGQYLIHYSDLFQDPDFGDEPDFAEWEEGLEEHMMDLFEGDVEPSGDMGPLPLNELDPEHVRDFLGWFVLRETSDSELIQAYADILRDFIDFAHAKGWWDQGKYQDFLEVLAEVAPEAVRAARLSRVLFHFVRSGGGMSPRVRGKQFSRFVEGHARAVRIEKNALYLNFDNQGEEIGPLALPAPVIDMLAPNDVFDVEMGLRGDTWVMVDIGPIYPACVYVEVEEYEGLEKLS